MRWLRPAALVAFAFLLLTTAQAQPAGGPTVFAAASLKNALDEIGAAWLGAGKAPIKVSFAASNTLAKQIELGAPADLFFSADLDWMDHLARKGLVREDTRISLLANRIVLIAPKTTTVSVSVRPGMDLIAALGDGRLAMGNVEAVPAGKYGRAALETLGAWEGVKGKIAQAESVRAALLLVSRGEAPLGIVYATDAAADPSVRVLGTFPENSHPPIIYPVSVLRDAKNGEAIPFLAFLRGEIAAALFRKQGFTVVDAPHGRP
jgi:molybdate transport system substrate-binding protein